MDLSQLRVGKRAIIKSISNKDMFISLKLMEMGCLPGEEVCVKIISPLGDPIAVEICGHSCLLSMRKKEAESIIL